ncbi:hypothetical protein AruPA_09770 [Acidiphilium sp. PA]|nr:hypothetical protein [Acidiphilium sp. PA]MCW8307322.1 hypothetical protein [Acidiphilium sp. PA]
MGEARLAVLSSIHLAEIERIGPELKNLLSMMEAARAKQVDLP